MNRKKNAPLAYSVFLVILIATGMLGCGAEKSPGPSAVSEGGLNAAQSETEQRLQELTAQREHDAFSTDFGIGPGDILDVSVPDMDEQKREERVSPQGTIDLPVAGNVYVNGLSEPQVHAAIANAYSKYIKNPEVDLFIQSYASPITPATP